MWSCGIHSWTCLRKYRAQICIYTDTNTVSKTFWRSPLLSQNLRKWKSNNYLICDLHSRSKRDWWKDVVVIIANTLLQRVEFGIWPSNNTEKFEISLGFASWDFKFFCGVWAKFHSPIQNHPKLLTVFNSFLIWSNSSLWRIMIALSSVSLFSGTRSMPRPERHYGWWWWWWWCT